MPSELTPQEWRVCVTGPGVRKTLPAATSKHAFQMAKRQAADHPQALVSVQSRRKGDTTGAWRARKIITPSEENS